MSILIRGLEMPKEGEYNMTLYVCSDGSAYMDVASFPVDKDKFEAVPIPPHGRLGDLDKMIWRLTPNEEFYPTEADRFEYDNGRLMVRDIRSFIRDQPTIIPAEPLEEET